MARHLASIFGERNGVETAAALYPLTLDLPDGRPQPPAINDGIVWRVVRRAEGRAIWRPLSISDFPRPHGARPLEDYTGAPQRKATPMDMSKYTGTTFVKLASVEHDPIEGNIAGVTEGKYGPNLVLESGDTINLNKTNARTLAKAWGKNSEDWIGKKVRAFAGELP